MNVNFDERKILTNNIHNTYYLLLYCSNLFKILQKFLKSNETLHLTATVDPSLIGGMIVSIADKYVDMSVASKVKKYTELISATV